MNLARQVTSQAWETQVPLLTACRREVSHVAPSTCQRRCGYAVAGHVALALLCEKRGTDLGAQLAGSSIGVLLQCQEFFLNMD